MKKAIITLVIVMASTTTFAQKKVNHYNENINPLEQIDKAVALAKSEGKHVICQVGGNWCPWCLRLIDHIDNDTLVNKKINENYIYIHVNYNPRKNTGSVSAKHAAALMQRLGNPSRFGFPVLVVLDSDGRIIHTQDSSFLEEGKGYSSEKILRFLKNWTKDAVRITR